MMLLSSSLEKFRSKGYELIFNMIAKSDDLDLILAEYEIERTAH